ncbi:MAG: hypothetical protein WC025_01000 [Candidatus Magasanikbacteria bacterium]
MTEIGNKILAVIKEKKLHPTSKFRFLFNSYLWAFFAFLMVIFGSLAVSVIIFYLRNEDWELYSRAGFSGFNFFVMMIPYFWIILSLIFVVLAYYNFHHTKFGYRYRFSVIIISYFVLSVVLGGGAYVFGAGEKIEGLFFNNNLVFYGQMMEKRQEIWNRPEMGFVAGNIIFVDLNNQELQILDPVQKKWFVDISNTGIPRFVKLDFNQRIRIIGQILSENKIKAEIIKPFFLEPKEHCKFENDADSDCILIHHRLILKENIPDLRIIN